MEMNKYVPYPQATNAEGTSNSNQIWELGEKALSEETFEEPSRTTKCKFWYESDVIDPSLG